MFSKLMELDKSICSESPDTLQHQILRLPDFPAGIEAFQLCAKFCCGITITLRAYNLVAAEYLQMTEDVVKGNLERLQQH
ncbi:hypothetical protein V6N11_075132 [Hibiscus sabdariffa]|uniref:Uncharacterized protein n=1 Tax=Hibiscus sabdariffa TaxID=183260 RepID=A0ABR2R5Q3_9ROSI